MVCPVGHPATRPPRVRKLLTISFMSRFGSCCSGFFVSQSDSGGNDEYFFLPKALAVPDAFAAPSLVGSEKASDATRAHQWRVCSAQRLPRIHLCKGRLKNTVCSSVRMPGVIAPGIFHFGRQD